MIRQFGHQLSFTDLYENLEKVDRAFLSYLREVDLHLHEKLLYARGFGVVSKKDESTLLIELAPYLQDFIAQIFKNEKAVASLSSQHHDLAPIFQIKRTFIQRKAARAIPCTHPETIRQTLVDWIGELNEISFAKAVIEWQQTGEKDKLACALSYAAWAVQTSAGQDYYKGGFLFHLPQKVDTQFLVPVVKKDQYYALAEEGIHTRIGFSHTDPGFNFEQTLDQAHYCIYCHIQERDSCSKGLRDRKSKELVNNENKITLEGCPLEEKISESHLLKSTGCVIGALAMIIVDNPMVAATGHRICNDCMKACIYQKQEPVNVPAIETSILDQVLSLPFGFEIYSLLTRWNPLNLKRPYPKPQTGYHVLIVGMGPSGFTLAHHLLNDGHNVVGIDGLKIEPLPQGLLTKPIEHIAALYENLDERIVGGFGGVAEYGITVRWNKNYLKVIRLLLERRMQFHLFGGIRFGGTLTPRQALDLGFDHIALCTGAGKPTIVPMKNALARGVRQASDFLIALQLTGAAKKDSIANLQLRLPAVVIGGGLTAIDTATEALAYYPIQVEKFLKRYELLVEQYGKEVVEFEWSPEDHSIAQEFMSHAKQLRQTDPSQYLQLLQKWGGVSVIYRKRLQDSPAYRLNHEEVHKAMQEGIWFYEQAIPEEVLLDSFGHTRALYLNTPEGRREKAAKSILVAAGTKPNITLSQEFPDSIQIDGHHFQAVDSSGKPVRVQSLAKPEKAYVLLGQNFEEKALSFFGDLHPSFAGNVVKAMASAKQGYPILSQALLNKKPKGMDLEKLKEMLRAQVISVKSLAPKIVEVIIQAPLAAQNFQPGQFYRLQNYETFARKTKDTTLAMEGLALTGAWVDKTKGLVALIVLEMGGSSELCRLLKPGEPIVLMGPTGSPTEIVKHKNVILIGGGLGNAVLFSIGQTLRQAGSTVIYFAGYKTKGSIFERSKIEAAADQVIWCCDEALLTVKRAQDKTFHGNIVQALEMFKQQGGIFPFEKTEHVITIGSDRMMAAVQRFFKKHKVDFKSQPNFVASINSPMQCMMKEICAQCLQTHIDPITREETIVFSCTNQDQNLLTADFSMLQNRLQQSSLSEKLTAQWIRLTTEGIHTTTK